MELESLIRRYVKLGKRSPKGFEACRCPICSDYKERGGFIMRADTIGWHCFNCGYDTKFDASVYKTPSEKFKRLLLAFGVPEDELSLVIGKSFIERRDQAPTGQQPRPTWTPPKAIDPPPGVPMSIMSDASPWCEIARDYLRERGLDPAAYPYMVTESLPGRVIIPYTHRDRLIYWQGRALTDAIQPRYYNPPVSDKEKLLFNYDELTDGANVLYVTEGALDALSIGPATAMSDSHVSEWKLAELRKAASRGRRIVFVVDKNKVGADLGRAALKEGWSVVVLPDGVDDANQGLRRFGRLWLLNYLASNAVDGVAGEVLLRMKCARDNRKQTKRA